MFVVPAEGLASLAQSHRTRLDHNHPIRRRRLRSQKSLASRGYFPIVRKSVQKIGQRFGMHVPMFDRHLQNPGIHFFETRIDPRTRSSAVALDFAFRRPIARQIRRRFARLGIDTTFEQAVELCMKSRSAHAAAGKEIPVKCVEVPEIENEPVGAPLRAARRGFRRNQPEELVRLITRMHQFPTQSLHTSGNRRWLGSGHDSMMLATSK